MGPMTYLQAFHRLHGIRLGTTARADQADEDSVPSPAEWGFLKPWPASPGK